jgi:hypothetical protein
MTPFFIVASPRSGSTLLRLMLSCHPEICVPQEAGFLITLFVGFRDYSGDSEETVEFVEKLLQSGKFENWKISREELLQGIHFRNPQNYSELIDAVYRIYIDVWQPSKSIWGDKNNFFLNRIGRIHECFPKAKFVHLVRDGRDVACSYRGLSSINGEHAPNFSTDLVSAANGWKANINKIDNSLKKIREDQKLIVRYEDLVLNPTDELSRICGFLGVAFNTEMMNYHAETYAHHYEPASFDKWKGLNKSGITKSRIGRWKREMFADNVFFFQKIAGKELESHGYRIEKTDFSIWKLMKSLLKNKV